MKCLKKMVNNVLNSFPKPKLTLGLGSFKKKKNPTDSPNHKNIQFMHIGNT